jgi:hypothetical protein
MGYQKLQVGRITAMERLLNNQEDTVNLDDELITFTTAAGSGTPGTVIIAPPNTFIDANGNNLINAGDLLVNTSSPVVKSSYIASVDSDTQLTMVTGITIGSGATCKVLAASHEPAVLYVGTHPGSGSITLKVRTEGGDDITFHNPPEGSFLPVQVKRVYNTGTTVSDILALF